MTRQFLLLTILLFLLSGCNTGPDSLSLDDLSVAEREYIEKYVILERARAVAMVDGVVGTALLDSLAVAWGESSGVAIGNALPIEPIRAAAVQNLLHKILVAENDSLVFAPFAHRVTEPLPEPGPPTADQP